MTPVVYPGSFDPVTNGHVDIVRRAASAFGHVIVAVANNVRKAGMFTVEERVAMLRESLEGVEGVEVDAFEGLLVDYMARKNCKVVIRGVRAVSDYESEFQMAHMNRQLSPGIETVFLVAGPEEFFISSSAVKEVTAFGGDVEHFVPAGVARRLRQLMESPRGGQ